MTWFGSPLPWQAVPCENEDDYCTCGRLVDANGVDIARFERLLDAMIVEDALKCIYGGAYELEGGC